MNIENLIFLKNLLDYEIVFYKIGKKKTKLKYISIINHYSNLLYLNICLKQLFSICIEYIKEDNSKIRFIVGSENFLIYTQKILENTSLNKKIIIHSNILDSLKKRFPGENTIILQFDCKMKHIDLFKILYNEENCLLFTFYPSNKKTYAEMYSFPTSISTNPIKFILFIISALNKIYKTHAKI